MPKVNKLELGKFSDGVKRIAIAVSILSAAAFASAEGLDTLIEVGRAKSKAAKMAQEETDNFENVKRALAEGSILKGQPKDSIRQRYGAPVIDFPKEKNKPETWIYKGADASFFDGPKIYLEFDDSGTLAGTKVVGKKMDLQPVEKTEPKDIGKNKNEMPVLRKSKRQRHRL